MKALVFLLSFIYLVVFYDAFSQIYNYGNIVVSGGTSVYVSLDLKNNTNGSIDNSGTIILNGNWENNNPNNFALINSSPGLVRLIGANQYIGGTNSTKFYNLSLEGSGIKSLQTNTEVEGNLNLNDRELNTNQYVLHVSNPSTNAISFTTGFVSSNQNGYLSRTMNQAQTYIFPVGSSSGTPRYRPVELTPNNNNQQVMGVRFANTDPNNEGYNTNITDGQVGNLNSQYFHEIRRISGNTSNDVAIYYDANADGSFNGIAHWDDQPSDRWEETAPATNTPGTPLSSLKISSWNDYTNPPFTFYGCIPSTPASSIQASSTSICGSQQVTLTVVGGSLGSGAQWQWYEGSCNGTLIGTGNSINVTPNTTTTYFVNAVGNCGTTSCVSITINVNPIPQVSVSSNSPLCEGQTLNLNASGGTQYQWAGPSNFSSNSPSPTINNITTQNAGIYYVTVTNADGCSNTSQINVVVNSLPQVSVSSNSPLCEGQTLNLNASGGTQYQWAGPSNFSSNSPSPTINNVTTQNAGLYYVTITNLCGNTIDTINVIINLVPNISLDKKDESCKGLNDGKITVNINSGQEPYTYLWSNGSTQNQLTQLTSGNYSVTITDANGCSSTDAITINNSEYDCFFIPTIFSPNGDGVNDVLYVRGHGIKEFLLKIYDRWGNLIFESTDQNIGWDGTYKGKPMNTGAYAYHLKIVFINGTEKEIKDNITLIR